MASSFQLERKSFFLLEKNHSQAARDPKFAEAMSSLAERLPGGWGQMPTIMCGVASRVCDPKFVVTRFFPSFFPTGKNSSRTMFFPRLIRFPTRNKSTCTGPIILWHMGQTVQNVAAASHADRQCTHPRRSDDADEDDEGR
jgi:hypothetical protein